MMPYGDPLSHIWNVKGIAEELPLSRLKYLTDQSDSTRKTASRNALDATSLKENDARPQAKPIRVNYSSCAGTATFGADPMVSHASVIHELAYGRIYADAQRATSEAHYPVSQEYRRHNLDLFV